MSQRYCNRIGLGLALVLLMPAFSQDVLAQALKARAGAKTSINAATTRPMPRPMPPSTVQRPVPPRPGGGITINQNNNVNIQGNQHGGHGYPPPPPAYHDDHHHGHDNDWDDWDDWDHHPFAVAAAVTAGAALTSAAIGSIVRTVPPQCVPVNLNGITYQQCGSTWYQPQYVGTSVQYVVVPPPG